MIKEYSTRDNNDGNSLLHLYADFQLVVHFVYDINTGTMACYFLLVNEALKVSVNLDKLAVSSYDGIHNYLIALDYTLWLVRNLHTALQLYFLWFDFYCTTTCSTAVTTESRLAMLS